MQRVDLHSLEGRQPADLLRGDSAALLPRPASPPSSASAPEPEPAPARLPTARSLDRILERLELSDSVRRSASAYFSSGEDIQIVKHEEIWI